MSSTEAVQVVHQMMEAREQEEARTAALASQVATPTNARKRFWKEVAVYPLTLVCAAVYTLLMAVAQ